MAGFQSSVAVQPVMAVPGDFASHNPRWAVNAGPGGLIAGALGVTVGRFAWLNESLTDANGAVITRRAISPAQFGLGTSRLAPASTQNIDLRFTAVRPVSGYTVEIFYP